MNLLENDGNNYGFNGIPAWEKIRHNQGENWGVHVHRKRLASRLMVLGLLAPEIGFCQDAMQILSKVGEMYRALTSYHFEGTTVVETNSNGARSTSETEFVVAYTAPKKFRVEFRYPNAGEWIRVSDGQTLSRYRTITKELKQEAAGADDLNILNGTLVMSFRDIDQGVKKATMLAPETVNIGGHQVECNVIEVERAQSPLLQGMQPLPERLWVDKARFVVLRRVSGTKSVMQSGGEGTENIRTSTFSVAEINQPIEDALFALNVSRKR